LVFVYIDLFRDDPFAAVVFITAIATALLIGISFHEFSHAFMADRLGDRLPRRMGRLTLNPAAHLDPAGTILLVFAGFGWGKPVPVNPNNTGNPKAALAATAAAGPLSNFLIAAVFGTFLRLDIVPWVSPFDLSNFDRLAVVGWSTDEYAGLYISSIVLFSVILGVFNLFPIAPLDGFKVAVGLLPNDIARSFAQLERWGPLILITLFLMPLLTGGQIAPLFEVMSPMIRFFVGIFAGIDQSIFVA
jgi:Zn-dependent protease